jgi:hypothetical protein
VASHAMLRAKWEKLAVAIAVNRLHNTVRKEQT